MRQYVRTAWAAIVTTCSLPLFSWQHALAAELRATVLDHGGAPLSGAAVVLEPLAGAAPAPRNRALAVMDQRQLRFVPELLVVQSGTAVSFPNSDQVLHQVYSFSAAKPFQLALYAGKAYPPVIFDRAGLVTLGCNIHDSMLGFILVVDSPWFAISDERGQVDVKTLPSGDYQVRLWHPHQKDTHAETRRRLTLTESGVAAVELQVDTPLRTPTHTHGTDKSWEDY